MSYIKMDTNHYYLAPGEGITSNPMEAVKWSDMQIAMNKFRIEADKTVLVSEDAMRVERAHYLRGKGKVEWKGGDQPVPDGTRVKVYFSDGSADADQVAEEWTWGHLNDNALGWNIVAFEVLPEDIGPVQRQAVDLSDDSKVRRFETGATRDTDVGKLDYEAFLSPELLEMYAQFMHYNRLQTDGKLRDGDNWQKGIPKDQCIKSQIRHVHAAWMWHRGYGDNVTVGPIWHQLAIIFNAFAYIKDHVRNDPGAFEEELAEAEALRSVGQKP